MTEKRKTLTIEVDSRAVTLTISRATARMGINRYLLASQGAKQNDEEMENGTGTQAERILRLITYPDCISSVTECVGMPWPITFERFCDLDEVDVDNWTAASYEVNPQWKPVPIPQPDLEKKMKISKRESVATSSLPPTMT
jgi:hypothetical protein